MPSIHVKAEGKIKCKTDEDAFKAVTEAYEWTMTWMAKHVGPDSSPTGSLQQENDGGTDAWFDIDMYVGDMATAYSAAQELAAYLHTWSHRWNVGEHLDVDDIIEVHISETMKEMKADGTEEAD